MSNIKPVWRMNAGLKIPLDHLEFALYRNGRLTNRPQSLSISALDFSIEGRWDDVMAYETTRTKPSKYRRKTCENCSGFGYVKLRGEK